MAPEQPTTQTSLTGPRWPRPSTPQEHPTAHPHGPWNCLALHMGQSWKSLESTQAWIQSTAQGGHLQSQGNWDALHIQFLTRGMLLSPVAAHEVDLVNFVNSCY